MATTSIQYVVAIVLFISSALPTWASPERRNSCRKTKVAVLGAGVAGITAAQALSNASITDFVIVEYNEEIGGRMRHAPFGKNSKGKPYTVELGANWIQGTVTEGGPENPIWTLAKKYHVKNAFSNLSSIQTFTEKGQVDYLAKLDDFDAGYEAVEYDSGVILSENLQDRSFRSGLNLAGYKPTGDPEAQAWEWFEMDFEYAQTPEVSSQEFTIANYVSPSSPGNLIGFDSGLENSTYYGFSEANNFVFDQRGYNTLLRGEASTFLKPQDHRLLLNTVVSNINWSSSGVKVSNKDGSCIQADYAICTFSVGVLQSDLVAFHPPLPRWKQIAISTFQMGVYTKIFLQFPPDKIFWKPGFQYLLYASPNRGYYPIHQPLDIPEFLPGSGIFVATVVTDQSHRIEAQSTERTKAELLAVLRVMFGRDAVPEPLDFMYPRWGKTPWARGSYSNWPPGLTLEGHQNLRANTGRLWFAGEATSQEYYGYLHGAYFEGKHAGEHIARCLNGYGGKECVQQGSMHYEVLKGTTTEEEYGPQNGWDVTSFQTVGDVDLVGGGG